MNKHTKKEKKEKGCKKYKRVYKNFKDKRKETSISVYLKKMDIERQQDLIEKLEAIKKYNDDSKPIRIGLLRLYLCSI